MADAWTIKAIPNGNVEIALGGQHVKISAEDAGRLATALLDCATAAGGQRTPVAGGPIDWLHVRPTTMSLGSSPVPGCEALVLGFGPALVGISLSKQSLRQLGQAMTALSAEGQGQ